jgi:uncharacterized membrane protein
MARPRSTIPFWSIPIIYTAATIVAGLVLPRLEFRYLSAFRHGMSAPVAIAVFSSVASGTLALTGIIFSLAFVMVQFSSLAYSPRLVLWFSRDPVISHGMGIFTATFIYSLSALGWVDRDGDGSVPYFSTWVVIVLVIASVMVLALLVERLATLQVSGVVASVGRKGRQVIGQMYPVLPADAAGNPTAVSPPGASVLRPPVSQVVTYTGAPMAIADYDVAGLVELAKGAEGLIVMPLAVGDTCIDGDPILVVHGGRRPVPSDAVHRTVSLQRQRTFDQDPKYALRLLVDIAIRALSPAVNDPTTAVQTLDEIEDLLHRLCARDLEAGQVRDNSGVLRVVVPTPTWEDFLSLAFDEIRQYGATSLQVMRRLRAALISLNRVAPPSRREAIGDYLAHLDVTAKQAIHDSEDLTTAMQQDRQGLGMSRGRR